MKPSNIIDIPTIDNQKLFERNRNRAESQNLDFCPCCGKAISNPRFAINSIYGGCAYPANDINKYNDAWIMLVGSECKKKFPQGYVFELPSE
jgi:hypothetical protein